MNSTLKLTQSEDYFMENIEEEWLLYKPTSRTAIYLDQTASIIWQLCDGSRSAVDVAQEISSHYPDDEETVAKDVLDTVEMLHHEGALLTMENN